MSTTEHSKSIQRETPEKPEHTIGITIAAFSVISVTIGAGMVSVPKAAYNSGIIWSLAYNLFNLIACVYSIHLFLRCAFVTRKFSMPELGYICFGRFSLYLINFLQIIAFGLTPIAYFIIFANLLRSFFNEISWVEHNSKNVIGSQWLSVLLLAVVLLPYIIKKKIEELKMAGVILFVGVSMFIFLLFLLKIIDGNKLETVDTSFDKLWLTNFDMNFVSSLSTAFVAYGFQSAFFPIFNSLKKDPRDSVMYMKGMKFTFFGMGFWFFIYTAVTFVSLYSFGNKIQGDVLQNVEVIRTWESYTLRAIFLVVLATHTPFVLFIGKESVLAIVALLFIRGKREEDLRKSIIITNSPTRRSAALPSETENLLVEDEIVNNNKNKKSFHENADLGEIVDKAIICGDNVKGIGASTTRKSFILKDDEMEREISGAADLLPNWLYYTVTLITYGVVVTAACTIRDVEIVIKFVGSLANALLNFTLPGLFYFIIMRKFNEGKAWWKLGLSLAIAIYGLGMGLFLTGINIYTTINPLDSETD